MLSFFSLLNVLTVRNYLFKGLTGKVSLPGLSCHDVTDRVFP